MPSSDLFIGSRLPNRPVGQERRGSGIKLRTLFAVALTCAAALSMALITSSANARRTPSQATVPHNAGFRQSTATPWTAAQLHAAMQHQLSTTSGGTQVGNDVVSYDNGTVNAVFPEPGSTAPPPYNPLKLRSAPGSDATPDADQGCPTGVEVHWDCFYHDTGFNGEMVEYEDCGYTQYFSSKFAQQTSSWVNTKYDAFVDVYGPNGGHLWHEVDGRNAGNGSYSYASNVGANDNKASSFKISVDQMIQGAICQSS